jgi:hypothetical protein
MPCDYEIDLANRVVRARAWGVLTCAEAAATRTRFAGDPAFRPDFSQLYDFREVTRVDMTGEEIRDFARFSPFAPGARRAAVATQSAVYGVLRMLGIQREVSGGQDEIRIFKSLEDAVKWLELEG